MSPSRFRTTLADRLLTEQVRQREEARGHPEDCPAADAAARQHGGDLRTRLQIRARHLPDADRQLHGIRSQLAALGTLALVVIGLAALGGLATAATALGSAAPVSLPLALLLIVAPNVLTLLLWLVLQTQGRRLAGLGALLHRAWQALASRLERRPSATPEPGALQPLIGGPAGRWLFASLTHGAWLAFGLGALAGLAVLLSVRAYELTWATTLLDDPTLDAWARRLSALPALLGLIPAPGTPLTDLTGEAGRQAWAQWLLATTFVYGVLPRGLALLISLGLLWRHLAPLGRDLQRPGYARLRARLLPDHQRLDHAAPPPVAAPALPQPLPPATLHGPVLGLALEYADDPGPPNLPEVVWTWLGRVDDAASRTAALDRLRQSDAPAVALRLRATLTPDRGIERYASALATATSAPVTLLLDEVAALTTRGETAARQRLADWQALSARAGLRGGVQSLP